MTVKQQPFAGMLRITLCALIVVSVLAIYVPVAPLFPSISLDGGWAFALNVAVERGLVFGRDIVFTFGPYGAAYTELYYPATDTMMLASTALLGTAFAFGLLCVAQGWHARLGALLLVALMAAMTRDSLFFALPFMLLLLVCRVAARGEPAEPLNRIRTTPFVVVSLTLLVLALSLLPLVKGTFAAATGMVMALSGMLLLLRGRWAMALVGAALFAVSMPLLWVLAGQPLAALPGFFISQAPIVSGYTEAMSMPSGLALPVLFCVCCLMLLVLHARARSVATVALILGSAGLLFFAFKSGFVRADTHMLMSAGVIAIVASLLALGRTDRRGLVGVAVGLICWAVIDVSATGISLTALPARIGAPFIAAADMLVIRLTKPTTLSRLYSNSKAVIASQHQLPELSGTTDIYSYGQSVLLARNLDWAPRPVLQSYSAYTPSLAAADAAFLTGPKAPQNILFTVQPIDNRLSSLEDGPSWPELLSRYEFFELHGEMAILRRRETPEPEPIAKMPVASGSFRMGEMMPLPEDTTPLWAKIDVVPTTLGKLVSAAFRPPVLAITFRFADGHQQAFRYISGMGAAGFLASPVVSSTNDFIALTLPHTNEYMAGKRPQSFTISAVQGVGTLWNPLVSVQLFAVTIPPQPNVGKLLFDRVETAAARLVKLPTTPDCAVDLINMHRPQDFPVHVGMVMRVDGWAAISVAAAQAPDVTSVTLTAPDGKVTAIRAAKIARNDVNTYFQKPDMGDIGYTATADLAGMNGDYLMSLEMTKGEQAWTCTTQVPVRVGNAE